MEIKVNAPVTIVVREVNNKHCNKGCAFYNKRNEYCGLFRLYLHYEVDDAKHVVHQLRCEPCLELTALEVP